MLEILLISYSIFYTEACSELSPIPSVGDPCDDARGVRHPLKDAAQDSFSRRLVAMNPALRFPDYLMDSSDTCPRYFRQSKTKVKNENTLLIVLCSYTVFLVVLGSFVNSIFISLVTKIRAPPLTRVKKRYTP